MKKIFILLALIFFVTGCGLKQEKDLEKIVNNVLASEEKNLSNKNFSGYKYYLPRGMILNNKLGYNSTFRYKSNNIYLYVDVISYYHKIKKEYKKVDGIYFSQILNYNDKNGIINVKKTKNNDKYFVEIEYNYGKIEAYSNEKDLNGVIINSLSILKTIRFNDSVIDSLIGDNQIEYKEEKFDMFKPEKEDNNHLSSSNGGYNNDDNDEDILLDDDKIIFDDEEGLPN